MENHDRTLKELATPDVVYQPWCIQYPQLEPAQTYDLKSGLIHLLPKFHGLAGEDPHKHLKEFHVERFNKLCATCPHHQISEQLLIQYFYEGLSIMDRSMIDAASGGALMDKTPAVYRLVSAMAELLSTETEPSRPQQRRSCLISVECRQTLQRWTTSVSNLKVPHSSSQSISAFGSLMTIAKHSSIAIPRNYAIATSSVGRD
ncbi:hypothetical protein CR513_39468, partial [Mucuna pruriens]